MAHGLLNRPACESYDHTSCCQEWLSYYESFCVSYPNKCTEAPRKLAKCDP